MAKIQKKKETGLADIELHPDTWDRFEAGVRSLRNTPVKVDTARPKPNSRKALNRSLKLSLFRPRFLALMTC